MYGRYDTIFRGTTQSIEIDVPYDTRLLSKIYATFTQEGQTVLELDVADVMLGEGKVWLPLQQADTNAFKAGFATMQMRALFSDGSAIASEHQMYRVVDALKEGVIS
jgi:archaellum component FlaF (FlaF/FlaG flagellin family)